jgi:hypothetical protein
MSMALLKNIRILEQRYLFLSKLSVAAQSQYVRSVASAAPAHKSRCHGSGAIVDHIRDQISIIPNLTSRTLT